ncbi:MAG: hypothetical protein QM533_08745 [Cytophagales bacterium]|nr:hypothetical protein [Cytophagales bacterium]
MPSTLTSLLVYLLAGVCCFNAVAQSQTSENAQVKNLVNQIIEVMYIKPAVSLFTDNIVLKLFKNKCEFNNKERLEPCQLLIKNYDFELRKNLNSKLFFKSLQASYESEFTLAELQQIYDFHTSPVASKIRMKLLPLISGDMTLDLQLISVQAFVAAQENTEKQIGKSLESLIAESNARGN